jgi:alpha-beta hydrolase superfamily lysophospholipase
MSVSRPAIVFVHGAYHPPACYSGVTTKLEAAGFEIVTPRLASLGKDAAGKTLDDDVATVQKAVEALTRLGKEVVVVGHSYGGFVSMIASHRLTTGNAKAGGKGAGLKAVAYISALVVEKGARAIDACNPTLIVPPDMTECFDIQIIDGKVCSSYFCLDRSALRLILSISPW